MIYPKLYKVKLYDKCLCGLNCIIDDETVRWIYKPEILQGLCWPKTKSNITDW